MDQVNDWIASLTEKRLTLRQLQVARALASGSSEKEIAKQLDITVHTVHSHVKKIYRCEGVHSRAELLLRIFSKAEKRQ